MNRTKSDRTGSDRTGSDRIGSDQTARRKTARKSAGPDWGTLGLNGPSLQRKRNGPRPVSRRAAGIGRKAAATGWGRRFSLPGRLDDGRNGRGG
ncbi:hypothetical protein CDL15_Pgr006261 [Punica granatum]|uniref:Uncharacterized protein n=1 Tax=Punica granatum TaxID=22663 RepID=A0A218X4N9_PUNGR|nr:hypothetical protein CDL15_Pgr006261 [Punica granatum]